MTVKKAVKKAVMTAESLKIARANDVYIYILKLDRICTVMTVESLIIDWAKKANEVESDLIGPD